MFFCWPLHEDLDEDVSHQLHADIGFSLEYLAGWMNDKDGWKETETERERQGNLCCHDDDDEEEEEEEDSDPL